MVTAEQPKRRVAFVLIDGLGDVSVPRFGYNTPLELASLPNLDAIASAGVNGLMDRSLNPHRCQFKQRI